MKSIQLTVLSIILSVFVASASQKKAVFISGTGRSGTSCVAGVLQLMGLEFGTSLCGANSYNEKGGFEDNRIAALNIELFKDLGMGRHTPHYHIDWHRYGKSFTKKVKQALQKYFSKFTVFGIKHPYISYLLPAYIGAAKELGYTPKIIIVLRHPKEIAQSFAQRYSAEPISRFYQLIGVSLMSLVEFCQGSDVLVVHYDDLLKKTKSAVNAIHAFLPELATYDQAGSKLRKFIDDRLKHEYKKKKLGYWLHTRQGAKSEK